MRRVIWVSACEIREGDILLALEEDDNYPTMEHWVVDARWDKQDCTFYIEAQSRDGEVVNGFYDPVEPLRFVVSGSIDFAISESQKTPR